MTESRKKAGGAAVRVSLLGKGECEVTHTASGVRLRTSKSPEYGGLGGSFSSTDLLAAALASCIATDLEPVAERHGVPLAAIHLEAGKRLGTSPKRVESLDVLVRVGAAVEDSVLLRLRRAADACLVQRSLDSEVRVRIRVERAPEGSGRPAASSTPPAP